MDSPFAPRFDNHQEPHPKQIEFEDQSVRLVLDRFGLADRAHDLVQRFQEKWGEPRLTFESFFETFPTFPLLLEAHSFYHVKKHCHPVVVIRSFEKTFFLQRYLDVYARGQQEAQGRPIGMIFNFGLKGGMVMHNGIFATEGTEIVHHMRDDRPPYRVKVEPFLPFIDYLACNGWTPDTPLQNHIPIQGPQTSGGMQIFPWMVEKLDASPALVILAWILKILDTPSVPERRFIHRLDNGLRYVRASRKEIASETRLSLPQVKRGLADLRDKDNGLIDKRRLLPIPTALAGSDR